MLVGWHGKSQPGAPVGRRRFRGRHGRPGRTQCFCWPSLQDSKKVGEVSWLVFPSRKVVFREKVSVVQMTPWQHWGHEKTSAFCLGGFDADGSGLIDYTEFLAATLDKYLSRSRCSMLSAVWIQVAKEEIWGTKKVPRSWIGKLRKCYLQEDVCYTAFSPKPQFEFKSFFPGKTSEKLDSAPTRCFWPGWWWTYHFRGWELQLQTDNKSLGCGCQTARSWRRSLRTAASTRPSERALANWIDMFLQKV